MDPKVIDACEKKLEVARLSQVRQRIFPGSFLALDDEALSVLFLRETGALSLLPESWRTSRQQEHCVPASALRASRSTACQEEHCVPERALRARKGIPHGCYHADKPSTRPLPPDKEGKLLKSGVPACS